jgi:hypothetical protein
MVSMDQLSVPEATPLAPVELFQVDLLQAVVVAGRASYGDCCVPCGVSALLYRGGDGHFRSLSVRSRIDDRKGF